MRIASPVEGHLSEKCKTANASAVRASTTGPFNHSLGAYDGRMRERSQNPRQGKKTLAHQRPVSLTQRLNLDKSKGNQRDPKQIWTENI